MIAAREGEFPTSDGCRLCGAPLERIFVDLGMSPLCETYPGPNELDEMEPFYPLRVHVCEACLLVQLKEYVPPDEIFREYPYFSSYSTSWLEHARGYARERIRTLELDRESLVVELASNGRELGQRLAREGRSADLMVANNVLAHVPDVHDFVAGIPPLLAPGGVVTMEFPHLLRLVEGNQFDTIYHDPSQPSVPSAQGPRELTCPGTTAERRALTRHRAGRYPWPTGRTTTRAIGPMRASRMHLHILLDLRLSEFLAEPAGGDARGGATE